MGDAADMAPQDTARQLLDISRGRPTTIHDALAAGLTRGQVRAALAAGTITRVSRGVITVTDVQGVSAQEVHLDAITAMAHTHDDLVFSHDTAAFLLGIPLPVGIPRDIHGYHAAPRRHPGLFRHRGTLAADDIVTVHGLMTTSPWRTACDLARRSSLPVGLMALDHVMRHRVLNLAGRPDLPADEVVELSDPVASAAAELREHVRRSVRRHGVNRLRLAAAAASPLAESPAESFARGHFLSAGIPIRGLQWRVVDSEGTPRRLDFLFDDGLAGECDGLMKYEGPEGTQALRKEKRRDLALAGVGIDTLRWAAGQFFIDPRSVISAIRSRRRSRMLSSPRVSR